MAITRMTERVLLFKLSAYNVRREGNIFPVPKRRLSAFSIFESGSKYLQSRPVLPFSRSQIAHAHKVP